MMSMPPQDEPQTSDGEDLVAEHTRRMIEAMEKIHRDTAQLLNQVNGIASRLPGPDPVSRSAPPESGAKRDEPSASDKPSIAVPTGQPVEPVSASGVDTDRVVQRVVEIVMDKIQPLLDKLAKIRDENLKPQPATEADQVNKMIEDIRQRVLRRRGFMPKFPQGNANS
jgi:hypothetical protein